jgi:hypothetical protein
MSNFSHSILFLFLFLFFIIWGKYIALIRKNSDYWIAAFVPILAYSIITGSRFGWGPDYLSYKYRLENAFKFPEEQIGFRWLNQGIKLIGFDYVGGYIIYSLIFMISAFVLIRSYKKVSIYMYYFIIPATLMMVTSAIRQGVALSFVLLALYFLNKKKWLGVILCVLIGASIHTAILVTVVIIGAIYLFIKRPLNWKLSIPLYLFFTFLFDTSSVGVIAIYIQKYVSLDSSFQSYIDNSDVWFGEEAASDIYQQSIIALFTSSLFYISIIYIGYCALKQKSHPQVVYIYNVVVIGIIFYRATFLYEILRRFAEPMLMLYFIVLGYSFFVIAEMKKNKQIVIVANCKTVKAPLLTNYKFFIGCVLFYMILFWGRFIFLNPDAMFYWDK